MQNYQNVTFYNKKRQRQEVSTQNSFRDGENLVNNNNNININSNNKDNQIICLKYSPADHVCMNLTCQKYAFVCSNTKCQCRLFHKNCIFIQTTVLMSRILSKSINIKPFCQSVDKKIQILIDRLSQLRDKLQKIKTQNAEYYGLTYNQVDFMKAVKQKNVKDITGKKVEKIYEELKRNGRLEVHFQSIEKRVEEVWKGVQRQYYAGEQIILQEFNKFEAHKKIDNLSIKSAFEQSKVIKSKQNVQKLIGFFQNQKIKQTKLLYRASENKFLVEKFYEKCSNVKNTLVVLETEYGKVLGGFTSLIWYKQKKIENVGDEACRSFIFSLTNNVKFSQVSKKQSIRRFKNNYFGPMFCGQFNYCLIISDRANIENESSFQIHPQTYFNKSYIKNSRQAWQKFIGSQGTSSFRIKQWQVWQANFYQAKKV